MAWSLQISQWMLPFAIYETVSLHECIFLLLVSDRCSAGICEDKSGPNLKALVQTHLHRYSEEFV